MTTSEEVIQEYIDDLEETAEDIETLVEDFFGQVDKKLKRSGNQGSLPSHQANKYGKSSFMRGNNNVSKRWATPEGPAKEKQRELLEKYERWYAKSEELVSQHFPRRLDQFEKYRSKFKKIIKLERTANRDSDEYVNMATNHFQEQQNVVKSIPGKIASKQLRLRRQITSEVATEELQQARELLDDGLSRASGVIAGVALERHLMTMCEQSEQEINYSHNDGISKLSNTLYESGEIDTTTKNRLESLGGMRNDCAHANRKEANEHKVRSLIEDTEDYVRGRGI